MRNVLCEDADRFIDRGEFPGNVGSRARRAEAHGDVRLEECVQRDLCFLGASRRRRVKPSRQPEPQLSAVLLDDSRLGYRFSIFNERLHRNVDRPR